MLDPIDPVVRDIEPRKDSKAVSFELPSSSRIVSGIEVQSQLLALKQALLAHQICSRGDSEWKMNSSAQPSP